MFIYINIYIYINYICLHLNLQKTHVYIFICSHIYIKKNMNIFVHTCAFKYVKTSIQIFTHIYIYICKYTFQYAHLYTRKINAYLNMYA